MNKTRIFSKDGWDPYLEDEATIWLIHWLMATNPQHATAWYWFFNRFHKPEFTSLEISALRGKVKLKYEYLAARTVDVEGLQSFIQYLADAKSADDIWLQRLLLFLGGRVPQKWTDNEREEALLKLAQLSKRLVVLDTQHCHINDQFDDDFDFIRLQIMRLGHADCQITVPIDKAKKKFTAPYKEKVSSTLEKAESWPDRGIVQEVLAQITWYHNLALLEKVKEPELRLWYAGQTFENGWSRNVLVFQIETRLHGRIGQTTNNFNTALPPVDSDMAGQVFKDPYIFDFLGTADLRREAELEQKLIDHLEKFLLELGQGFAFVGRQVHMEVGEDDFYIDLLFYHLKLRCYVVVELKAGKFQAGHVSQLNMYMNIVNDLMRHPDDKKTIGLLLVKEKNQTIAKYALDGYTNPIGVAKWEKQITDSLPDELKSSLPTIEEIEAELKGPNE